MRSVLDKLLGRLVTIDTMFLQSKKEQVMNLPEEIPEEIGARIRIAAGDNERRRERERQGFIIEQGTQQIYYMRRDFKRLLDDPKGLAVAVADGARRLSGLVRGMRLLEERAAAKPDNRTEHR